MPSHGRRAPGAGWARLEDGRHFPPGGEALYRRLARLVELGPGREFLVAPCGEGVTAVFLGEISGAPGAGVDPDPELLAAAAARARRAGLADRLQFESAPLEDLPFQDAVFDVAVGEIGLAATADVAAAVRELARVTRPLGAVALLQLVWTGNVDAERGEELVRQLGVRPLLLVEWKQLLRDAGVVDLHVEDWSDAVAGLPEPLLPRRLGELRSLTARLAAFAREGRRWGWRRARAARTRDRELYRLVARERLVGLSLIQGTKWPGPPG